MKKRFFAIAALAMLTLGLTSCHKECGCVSYDGSEHVYSAAEVEANGGSCDNMVWLGTTRFYSVCSWE
ncbi:MAG: hypothetical protein IJ761_07125 [Bacteroidales bacterium]|nr:hypothetical protein [Bacteroidales bacterium]